VGAAPAAPSSLPSGTDAHRRTRGHRRASRPPVALAPAASRLFTAPGSGGAGNHRDGETASGPATGDLLVVAVPLDDVQSTLQQLLVLELAIAGGMTLVVVLATALLGAARAAAAGADRLDGAVDRLSDLSQRVTPATERTDVERLGLALNSMLGQLEEALIEREANEQQLRHFVSDASHELRTPLTSMRGYAELLRRNPEMSAEDMTLAMRRIDEETQRIARLDQGRPLESRPVDLEALVADAWADTRAADGGRAITRVTAPLVVAGDQMRLRQVLSNLLRNALVHTPPPGLRRGGPHHGGRRHLPDPAPPPGRQGVR
jgi:two-component system, OmpR family, sensor kinase